MWVADTRSSIYIPADDDQKSAIIHGIVEDYYGFINIVDGKLNKDVIRMHQVQTNKSFSTFIYRCPLHTGTDNNTNKNTKFNADRGWNAPTAVAVGAFLYIHF